MVKRIERTDEPPKHERREPAAEPDRASADVGSRVSGILAAAEDAAEEIRSAARADAEAILREAETAAAARMRELTHEAERVRSQAEDEVRDLRLAVDAYAKRRRAEAEDEARSVREGAAAKLRDAEQALATALERAEQEARRRHRELVEETRALDQRRVETVQELRRLVADLEDAIETGSRHERPSTARPQQQPDRQQQPADSLPDTLGRETRRLRRRTTIGHQ